MFLILLKANFISFVTYLIWTDPRFLAQQFWGKTYSLGIVVVVQKLTIRNISVITEDIHSKLRVCVPYPKSNPYYQGRQFKMHFFQNYAPFKFSI